jgi:hypothetical protein
VERVIGTIRRECLDHVIVPGLIQSTSPISSYDNPSARSLKHSISFRESIDVSC